MSKNNNISDTIYSIFCLLAITFGSFMMGTTFPGIGGYKSVWVKTDQLDVRPNEVQEVLIAREKPSDGDWTKVYFDK